MSGILPHWLESYFGLEPSAAGEGVVWRLDNSWPWNPWVTLLFVIFVVALVVAVYRHEIGNAGRGLRAGLIALRLIAIGLVLAMIAQWILKLNPTQLPYLIVMVDDSQSMRISRSLCQRQAAGRDRAPHQATRLARESPASIRPKCLLLENDAALLKGFNRRYKLKVYFCSELARPQSTRFGRTVRKAIAASSRPARRPGWATTSELVLTDPGLTGIAAS